MLSANIPHSIKYSGIISPIVFGLTRTKPVGSAIVNIIKKFIVRIINNNAFAILYHFKPFHSLQLRQLLAFA